MVLVSCCDPPVSILTAELTLARRTSRPPFFLRQGLERIDTLLRTLREPPGADVARDTLLSRIFNHIVWTWSQRSFSRQVDALLQLRDAAISFKVRSGYGHASSLGELALFKTTGVRLLELAK